MNKPNPIILTILVLALALLPELNCQNVQQNKDVYSFLNKHKIKEIPLVDSTCFDNFQYTEKLTKEQMELLKLNEICSPNNINFILASVNYKLRLSDKYNTLVITYSPSELILITVLVNYDLSFNLIDFKMIAFDENFDNWGRTFSEILKGKIQVTSIDYSTGKPIKKSRTLSIAENGKIIPATNTDNAM